VKLEITRPDAHALAIAAILEPHLILSGGDGGERQHDNPCRYPRRDPFHHLLKLYLRRA
jgi:hypothetical protein